MAEKSRSPDFKLMAMPRGNPKKGHRIGAGWKNDDGSVSIVLDHFVRLDGRDDIVITLFLKDREG